MGGPGGGRGVSGGVGNCGGWCLVPGMGDGVVGKLNWSGSRGKGVRCEELVGVGV